MKLKRSVKFIIPAVVVVLIVVAVVVHTLPKKKQTNSADAAGNTAGNLMNGGLFCEYNNKIYFANPYDHNYLYVMDSDCSNARMLNSDSVASLNIYNDKIYYVKNNFSKEMIGTILRGQLFGIYQTDLEGQNSTMLYNHLTGSVSLCGNYLYYQHYESDVGITLHRMDIDGENDKLVSNTPYNPSCVSEGKIYFPIRIRKMLSAHSTRRTIPFPCITMRIHIYRIPRGIMFTTLIFPRDIHWCASIRIQRRLNCFTEKITAR